MAESLEESDYASIQQRVLQQVAIIAVRGPASAEALPEDLRSAIGRLMPFSDQVATKEATANPERTTP